MHFSFVHILSEEVIRALCWTFLHSLWQGFLLAILAAAVLLSTRKRTAALRYNLLFALFALFLAATGFTFAQQLHISSGGSAAGGPFSGIVPAPADVSVPGATSTSTIADFVRYFNRNAALIVTIWFIVFLAKSVRMLSGLVYLQKIRHTNVFAPGAEWQQRIAELSDQLRLSMPVKLLESGIVKVPVVIGVLKPVILLPLGLLANLPPDQLEAILLHELAHIRRGDYFANLVQSVAEILFFFNPAVLWVSSLIRDEREHCCDDIAVGATRSKAKFINALIAFQEYSYGTGPALATAFPGTGKKTYLLDRARRIVNNKNKTLNNMEKLSVLCCLVFVCTLLIFLSAPQRSSASPVHLPASAMTVRLDMPTKVDTAGKPVKTGTQRVLGKQTSDSKDSTQKDVLKAVLADLVKEDLVKQSEVEDVSFKLTAKELIINGTKQPADIQKKLSNKYITAPSMKIMYHWWGD